MRPMSRASQLAALVVGSQEGERILDGCAAPGGKTAMLRGEVTAVELHAGRARALAESAGPNVRVVNADLRELDERGFDRALVDAPCSGLGVLARRPDLRWRARPLPELQLELLRAAAERTKPGGTIVYSVCTLNADENEAVVDASGLDVEPLADEWPQYAHPKRPEFLLTRPDRDRTSGFFIARLRNRPE
jgi:16S rRNA (cytosine967-C5)-methyltransferase